MCIFYFNASNAQNTRAYYQSLFLLKFIKYANWTKQPDYYKIGVVGNTPVIPHLKTMTKKRRVNGKPVVLYKINSYADLGKYSLIYIPRNQNSKVKYIVSRTKNKDVLIVTEDDRYIYRGALISFYERNKALKFKINTRATARRKIQISRRLLSVATVIN